MRAAVLERDQLTVLGAHRHDGHGAHERGAIVANVGKLGLEAQEVPDGTFEQALLLEGEHVGIGVDPVRDAGQAGGPYTVDDCIHYASSSVQSRVRHARRDQNIDRSRTGGKQRSGAGISCRA